MTDREQGNTDAPRVEENGVRSGDDRAGSGSRRISEVREEREAGRNSGTAASSGADQNTDRDAHRSADRGTSWLSVILG